MTVSNMLDFDNIYDIKENIKNKLYEFFALKDIRNEYKEVLYEIHVTFKNNNAKSIYLFKKKIPYYNKIPCYECVKQNCKCSCLVDGRVRRLHLIEQLFHKSHNMSHNVPEGFGSYTITEDADNEVSGYINFSNSKDEPFRFKTKMLWVWCKGRIKIGEFEHGPRIQEASLGSHYTIIESPLAEIMRGG